MKRILVLISIIAFVGCAHKHDGEHNHSAHHSFKDAQKWSKAFDDPARDQWQKPEFVIENLDLKKSKCVADIGAGTGYFSTRIARQLPKTSTVFAVDIEPDMIAHLKVRAQNEGLNNHKELLSTEEFPQIPTDCDLVLLVDTYHHISNRSAYFKSGLLHLNKRGRVAIVDFTMESPMGPKKEHRLPKNQVVAEMQQAGYKLEKDISGLPNQYFLIFRRL